MDMVSVQLLVLTSLLSAITDMSSRLVSFINYCTSFELRILENFFICLPALFTSFSLVHLLY
ncbi:hypothetical protein BGX38DRAFT_1169354 [Terfezia claveryi]|nr:hypothetical protein BGX38DRAFT_1169354 [Terfezia claveryi]